MGTATRKAAKRESFRQSLAATAYSKADDAGAARKLVKALSNSWIKRGEQPGNFHAPDGQVMRAKCDARGINSTLRSAGRSF